MFCDYYALIFSPLINIPYHNFFLFFQKKKSFKSPERKSKIPMSILKSARKDWKMKK